MSAQIIPAACAAAAPAAHEPPHCPRNRQQHPQHRRVEHRVDREPGPDWTKWKPTFVINAPQPALVIRVWHGRWHRSHPVTSGNGFVLVTISCAKTFSAHRECRKTALNQVKADGAAIDRRLSTTDSLRPPRSHRLGAELLGI